MPTLNLDNAGQNHEVLPGFRFTLMVEGFQEVPLKSVRPFSKENEFETIEEGGMNDFVRIKRKHATKPHTIQVERYLNQDFYDPIPNGGAEFILPLLLFVGGNNAQEFGWSGSQRVFVFFGSMVMNREIGGFDSEKSGLLTETITIAYNQLYTMDVPGDENKEAWKFDGNIANQYANQGTFGEIEANKMKKTEFIMKASENMWTFGEDETEYLGNGVRHTLSEFEKLNPQNQQKKQTLDSRAKTMTWHFGSDETEYEGAVGARSYEEEEKKVRKNLVKKSTLSSKAKGATWHFGKGPDDYVGNDKRHAQEGQPRIRQNEVEKDTLAAEAEAATWHFSDGVKGVYDKTQLESKAEEETWKFGNDASQYEGSGKRHAADGQPVITQNQKTREQLAGAAAGETWKFGNDAGKYEGTGNRHNMEAETPIAQNATTKASLASKAEADTWKFGSDASQYEGTGTRHAANGQMPIPQNEKTKEQIAGAAQTWPAKSYATHNEGEATQRDLEGKMRTWPAASYAAKVPGSKEKLMMK